MRKKQQLKYNQSILDFLVDIPELKNKLLRENMVNANAADALFSIWKDKKNVISSNSLKIPESVDKVEIEIMSKEGLVKNIGDMLQVTSKGKQVIKMLILGDERSSFDDDGSNISMKEASRNINERSLKKRDKKTADDWWSRF